MSASAYAKLPDLVKTHAAPAFELLSVGPPTMAVLPSADTATERPWLASPTAPVPTSFGPCCVNCASASCDEKSRVAENRTEKTMRLNDISVPPPATYGSGGRRR